jgi:hypothetical protein
MEIKASDVREIEYLYCLRKNCKFKPYFLHHFRCGRRSNIPVCCMIFFVTFWQACWILGHFPLVKRFLSYYPSTKYHKYRYVPCFYCYLMGRCNRVLTCDKDCKSCCQY